MRTSLGTEGRRSGAVTLTLLAVLVGACAGPSSDGVSRSAAAEETHRATDSTSPTSIIDTTPSPDASRPTVSPTSASTRGAPAPPTLGPYARTGLVLRYSPPCDVCPDGLISGGIVVLDDGRVIWRSSQGLRVRSLTALGLERIRAEVAIPALEKSATYAPTLRAGSTAPPAHGIAIHGFMLERASTRILVLAYDAPSFTAEGPGLYDVPDGAIVLSALGARAQELETWIAPEEWATPASAYIPERYLLIVDRLIGGAQGTVDADSVAWPFGQVDTIGAEYALPYASATVPDSRCLAISAEAARSTVAVEVAAGAGHRQLETYDEIAYLWGRGGGSVAVATYPLLPYQSNDCTDAFAW